MVCGKSVVVDMIPVHFGYVNLLRYNEMLAYFNEVCFIDHSIFLWKKKQMEINRIVNLFGTVGNSRNFENWHIFCSVIYWFRRVK